MRIVFAGSPLIAVPSLNSVADLSLNAAGFTLSAVITKPDSARGRSKTPIPTEIALACADFSEKFRGKELDPIKIFKPEQLDGAFTGEIKQLKPDLLVSFAYGKIFPPDFLSVFPLGGINIHPSLLPAYRGATPIPQAILNRDTKTGITIQYIDARTDCGDIILQEEIALDFSETTESLSETVAEKSPPLLLEALRLIKDGAATRRKQDEIYASYCALKKKSDGIIDWKQSAEEIDARVRAFYPYPLSQTAHNGKELYIIKGKIYPAGLGAPAIEPGSAAPGAVLALDKKNGILIQTGKGIYCAEVLQYKTKKALDYKAFANGARDFIGSRLE